MRRKKATIKRTRRSPYERSLEYATKRLAKATEEHVQCQAKLEALNKEIPYLQTVIRALTPREMKHEGGGVYSLPLSAADTNARSISIRGPVSAVRVIPDNIDPFLNEIPSEEDQFLNVAIPGEKEILS